MAITIFSFPPDKGNVGTAAYLNVFDSIRSVMLELKRQGYDLPEDMPESAEDLMNCILHDKVRLPSPLALVGSERTPNLSPMGPMLSSLFLILCPLSL